MSEILGVLFAVLVGLQLLPNAMRLWQTSSDNTRAAAAAQQQRQVLDASTLYIKQNVGAVQAAATPTTPVVITVPMLQAGNFLPAAFAPTNPWGQTWQTQVLQPAAGNLQALALSTGGTALRDMLVAKIASLVGAQGGFIPSNDSGAYAAGPGNAYGAYGGWNVATANYAGVAGGHLAALVTLTNGQVASNYLYRTAVPGQPQLNAMQTDLSLTDAGGAAHNINGANNVGAAGNVSAGGNVTAAGQLTAGNGNFTTDAQGKIGTNGFATNSLPGGWTGGVSTMDVYGRGTIGVGNGGAVAASLTSSGAVYAANGNFQVTAGGVINLATQGASGAACNVASGSSAMTTDAAGVPLACVGGIWRPVGGQLQSAAFYNGVLDGTVIPAPTCPGTAVPLARATVTSVYINPTASATYFSSGTGPWVMNIRDGTNTPIPGAMAQVETFCAFS